MILLVPLCENTIPIFIKQCLKHLFHARFFEEN